MMLLVKSIGHGQNVWIFYWNIGEILDISGGVETGTKNRLQKIENITNELWVNNSSKNWQQETSWSQHKKSPINQQIFQNIANKSTINPSFFKKKKKNGDK